MRIVKDHREREIEILDTASRLFSEKGYGKCSVNDILNEIGIAKGTFYHYFKSKEEVLDAIVLRIGEQIVKKAAAAAVDPALSPEEKLLQIFLAMRVSDEMGGGLVEEMHQPENALMHQKSLSFIVTAVAPVLADVVKEGIDSGNFTCEYPEEYMHIFLTSAMTVLDEGIFEIESWRRGKILKALIALLGNMLGISDRQLWEKSAEYWNQEGSYASENINP